MGKPDAITRRAGDDKLGSEERIFAEGQLRSNDNDDFQLQPQLFYILTKASTRASTLQMLNSI